MTKNVWYFSDGITECDFIYKLEEEYYAIQVCYELQRDNQERETQGLLSAMQFFKLKEGIILTIDQSDLILTDGYKIKVIPAWQFEIPL